MKRVLLDVNVNHRFAALITGHDVVHAFHLGWAELRNGELIASAEDQSFDVLITADKQMQYQQDLSGRTLSILVLASTFVRWEDIYPLAPQVQSILDGELKRGSFITIAPEENV